MVMLDQLGLDPWSVVADHHVIIGRSSLWLADHAIEMVR